jgi:hypothetical protein
MDCPVCKNAMITLELAGVEIDHCNTCNGIWLDAGEMELLLGSSEKSKKLLDSFKTASHSAEKARKCPICLKKMQKIIVGQAASPLLIDRCGKGDGLWFDKGELQNILTLGTFDEENKVVKLLTDMFGH